MILQLKTVLLILFFIPFTAVLSFPVSEEDVESFYGSCLEYYEAYFPEISQRTSQVERFFETEKGRPSQRRAYSEEALLTHLSRNSSSYNPNTQSFRAKAGEKAPLVRNTKKIPQALRVAVDLEFYSLLDRLKIIQRVQHMIKPGDGVSVNSQDYPSIILKKNGVSFLYEKRETSAQPGNYLNGFCNGNIHQKSGKERLMFRIMLPETLASLLQEEGEEVLRAVIHDLKMSFTQNPTYSLDRNIILDSSDEDRPWTAKVFSYEQFIESTSLLVHGEIAKRLYPRDFVRTLPVGLGIIMAFEIAEKDPFFLSSFLGGEYQIFSGVKEERFGNFKLLCRKYLEMLEQEKGELFPSLHEKMRKKLDLFLNYGFIGTIEEAEIFLEADREKELEAANMIEEEFDMKESLQGGPSRPIVYSSKKTELEELVDSLKESASTSSAVPPLELGKKKKKKKSLCILDPLEGTATSSSSPPSLDFGKKKKKMKSREIPDDDF